MKKLPPLLIITLLFFNSCSNSCQKKELPVLIKDLVQKVIQNEVVYYYDNKSYSGCADAFYVSGLEFWKTKKNREFKYLLEDSTFLSFANIPNVSPGVAEINAPNIYAFPSPIIANINNTELDKKRAREYIDSKYEDGTFYEDEVFYFSDTIQHRHPIVGNKIYNNFVQLIALEKSYIYGDFDGPVLLGKHINDAYQGFNHQTGAVTIFINMNEDGARLFSHITNNELGNEIAIVLDKVVYTFPVIRDKIEGGFVEIGGNFTVKEAQNIASIISGTLLKKKICYEDGKKISEHCFNTKGLRIQCE